MHIFNGPIFAQSLPFVVLFDGFDSVLDEFRIAVGNLGAERLDQRPKLAGSLVLRNDRGGRSDGRRRRGRRRLGGRRTRTTFTSFWRLFVEAVRG